MAHETTGSQPIDGVREADAPSGPQSLAEPSSTPATASARDQVSGPPPLPVGTSRAPPSGSPSALRSGAGADARRQPGESRPAEAGEPTGAERASSLPPPGRLAEPDGQPRPTAASDSQPGRRTARRRSAGPSRPNVAANDDVPSIGGLIFALHQKPSRRPLELAALGSIVWALASVLLGWAMLAPELQRAPMTPPPQITTCMAGFSGTSDPVCNQIPRSGTVSLWRWIS